MWPSLDPGDLRHLITWQRKEVTGQDSFGQDVFSWVDVMQCHAQVKMLFGRELESAQQRWAEARYAIRQHYVEGLRVGDRIAWAQTLESTRYLDVLDVSDREGMSVVLDITAKEWIP